MRIRAYRPAGIRGLAALAVLAAGTLLTTAPTASAEPAETNCNHIDDAARPTVRPGEVSAAVRQVQCLINHYSRYTRWLEEDGDYGPKTLEGVHWVQTCNGTTGGADGIVGSSTWSRLYTPKSECAFSQGAMTGGTR
jgi:peptidoglycan hydrolase-like protein with peptidoglycan-binding domain